MISSSISFLAPSRLPYFDSSRIQGAIRSPYVRPADALILAMRATGDVTSLDEAPHVGAIGNVAPDAKAGHAYDALFAQYRAIYSAMAPHWDAISAWQAGQDPE